MKKIMSIMLVVSLALMGSALAEDTEEAEPMLPPDMTAMPEMGERPDGWAGMEPFEEGNTLTLEADAITYVAAEDGTLAESGTIAAGTPCTVVSVQAYEEDRYLLVSYESDGETKEALISMMAVVGDIPEDMKKDHGEKPEGETPCGGGPDGEKPEGQPAKGEKDQQAEEADDGE